MVEVAVSIEQEFISPCSPLQPLRNRFCLLNALGLPIRIVDADGTKTVNKCAFFLVTYLPWISLLSVNVALSFTSGINSDPAKLKKSLTDDGFEKWDVNITWALMACALLNPLFYLCCYKGLGGRVTKFIQHYQKTFHNLETGG